MTNLDIYNPAKVRGIVEAKDARIAELERQVASLKAQLKEAEQEARDDRRAAADEATWRVIQGEDYGSY